MVANRAPQHTQPARVSYFRPAELLVLFRRLGGEIEDIAGSLAYDAMREAFRIKARVVLYPESDPFLPHTDNDPSESVDIRRQGRRPHLFRPIALVNWRDDLANHDGTGDEPSGV